VLDDATACGSEAIGAGNPQHGEKERILEGMEPYRATTRRHLATSPFNAPAPRELKEFAAGDRVTHDREGLGRVTAVEDGIAVVVDFGTRKVRVTAPFTKLHRL
jgi:hypothetical protein